jgi:chemotaxis signal transduction protein
VVKLEMELIGVVVDMVQDVIRIQKDTLSDSPAAGIGGERKNYTSQIASINGKIKQILDVNAVFGISVE